MEKNTNKMLGILLCMMICSFAAGVFHSFVTIEQFHIQRVHVFLFNLCTGGSILLMNSKKIENRIVIIFLIISFLFTISAAVEMFSIAICFTLFLMILVEKVRIKNFSFFPYDFFSLKIPVFVKFHHAALLCLSISLPISALSMFAHIMRLPLPEKMTLDIFFLGFSFPVSLLVMSRLFEQMHESIDSFVNVINNMLFWVINIGVIVFFIFILSEKIILQIAIAVVLFFSVVIISMLFYKNAKDDEMLFLSFSAMMFLILSAISGVAYIVVKSFLGNYQHLLGKYCLELHRYVSLYGWNQAGMMLVLQKGRILRLSKTHLILHWCAVAIFAPLSLFHWSFAIMAFILYVAFIYYHFWA